MGAQGTTTVNFGAFPGASDTSVAVTGQTAIVGGSLVEAYLFPVATSDHGVDEHLVDPPRIVAGNVVAGTGFTIYAFARPGSDSGDQPTHPTLRYFGGDSPRPYGVWTVAWVWN